LSKCNSFDENLQNLLQFGLKDVVVLVMIFAGVRLVQVALLLV